MLFNSCVQAIFKLVVLSVYSCRVRACHRFLRPAHIRAQQEEDESTGHENIRICSSVFIFLGARAALKPVSAEKRSYKHFVESKCCQQQKTKGETKNAASNSLRYSITMVLRRFLTPVTFLYLKLVNNFHEPSVLICVGRGRLAVCRRILWH